MAYQWKKKKTYRNKVKFCPLFESNVEAPEYCDYAPKCNFYVNKVCKFKKGKDKSIHD